MRNGFVALGTVVPALLCAVLAAGCAAASGSGPYRGLQLYGSDVYVCREAPTAGSAEALARELGSQPQDRDSPTGLSVSIRERSDVDVRGRAVAVARVSAVEGDRTFWLPYTALCSRGDQ